ncbi:MAG TPA: WbuC family cupin fold metalloprotein [Rhodocyclaceae bacterium]
MIKLIDNALLDAVCAEAQASPRGRKNRNFHPRDDHPAHRLLNAIEPGSYVPPHRHNDANKDETMLVLRGALGLVEFDTEGQVLRASRLTPAGPLLGCDIPHGTYHSVLALEPGTLFLEAKGGPYAPLTAEEQATWAPRENESGAEDYYRRLVALFD